MFGCISLCLHIVHNHRQCHLWFQRWLPIAFNCCLTSLDTCNTSWWFLLKEMTKYRFPSIVVLQASGHIYNTSQKYIPNWCSIFTKWMTPLKTFNCLLFDNDFFFYNAWYEANTIADIENKWMNFSTSTCCSVQNYPKHQLLCPKLETRHISTSPSMPQSVGRSGGQDELKSIIMTSNDELWSSTN